MTRPRATGRRRPPDLPEAPGFIVPTSRTLRRVGLGGAAVEIGLDGNALTLADDQGGRIDLPANEVDCLRITSYRARYGPTFYETRIWPRGARRPVVIAPMNHDRGDYGPIMRSFAGWVVADGGRVLRGPSLVALVIQLTWTVGSISLIALVMLGGAIAEGLWWMWLITFLVAGLAVLLFVGLRRTYWPRVVTRPEHLDELLPQAEEKCR